MPLFTLCETQGLFHDFPGLFQGYPGSSLSTKTWTLYILLSKQTLLFAFTDMADPDNEKQPMTGHFDETHALWSHGFCFTALSYQKYFN